MAWYKNDNIKLHKSRHGYHTKTKKRSYMCLNSIKESKIKIYIEYKKSEIDLTSSVILMGMRVGVGVGMQGVVGWQGLGGRLLFTARLV